jgi:hypothetical protein
VTVTVAGIAWMDAKASGTVLRRLDTADVDVSTGALWELDTSY